MQNVKCLRNLLTKTSKIQSLRASYYLNEKLDGYMDNYSSGVNA